MKIQLLQLRPVYKKILKIISFRFSIYGEDKNYAVNDAIFNSGNAGNSFYFNSHIGFSTPDNDNDR